MKAISKLPEWIIRISFHFSVWLIERFHHMKTFEEQVDQLRKLNKGTLGREIADCLDKNNLRLVPGFESHDLKHSLLGFKMTPVDEIRMQAFMIGNGNISIPSLAIFTFGFLLLPHLWMRFARDFHEGLNSQAIKDWTIEEYADKDLTLLRRQVFMTDRKTFHLHSLIQKLAYIGSFTALFAGIGGMLYCLPFLFSPVLEDLIGAGFPFVGGAILATGGLISLSIQSKKEKKSYKMA